MIRLRLVTWVIVVIVFLWNSVDVAIVKQQVSHLKLLATTQKTTTIKQTTDQDDDDRSNGSLFEQSTTTKTMTTTTLSETTTTTTNLSSSSRSSFVVVDDDVNEEKNKTKSAGKEVNPNKNRDTVATTTTPQQQKQQSLSPKTTTTTTRPQTTTTTINTTAVVVVNKLQVPTTTKEKNDNILQTTNRIFEHFFSHIPKTGSTYAFQMFGKLLYNMPQWKNLSQEERFRACDEAKRPLVVFETHYRKEYKRTKCTLWMSEQPYDKQPKHTYTIVRNPHHHVLSQYFHCLESTNHKRYVQFLPKKVTIWLRLWVDILNKNETVTMQSYHIDQRFKCYDPRNMQSYFLGYDTNNNNNNNNNMDDKTKKLMLAASQQGKEDDDATTQQLLIEDLYQRYDVIGDNAHMDKSVCLIFIRYTGWVPDRCNCTATRRLDSSFFDHGVKHHGYSFQTTDEQKELLDKLTITDRYLYNHITTKVFQRQIKEVEEEYKIHICETIQTD